MKAKSLLVLAVLLIAILPLVLYRPPEVAATQASFVQVNAHATTTSHSYSQAFGSNVVAGNILVVAVGGSSLNQVDSQSATFAITDTLTSSYTSGVLKVKQLIAGVCNGSCAAYTQIFTVVAGSSAADTVTVTITCPGNACDDVHTDMVIYEATSVANTPLVSHSDSGQTTPVNICAGGGLTVVGPTSFTLDVAGGGLTFYYPAHTNAWGGGTTTADFTYSSAIGTDHIKLSSFTPGSGTLTVAAFGVSCEVSDGDWAIATLTLPVAAAASNGLGCTSGIGAVIGTRSASITALVANQTYLYYAESPPYSGLTVTNVSAMFQAISLSGTSDTRVKLTIGIYEVQPQSMGTNVISSYQQPSPPWFPLVLLKSAIITLPSVASQSYFSVLSLSGTIIDPARIWAISIASQHTGVQMFKTSSNVNQLTDSVVENTPSVIYSVSANPVTVATGNPLYFYAKTQCPNAIVTQTISTTCTTVVQAGCMATSTTFTVTTSTTGNFNQASSPVLSIGLLFLLAPLAVFLPAGAGLAGAMLGLTTGLVFTTVFGLFPIWLLIPIVAVLVWMIVSRLRG